MEMSQTWSLWHPPRYAFLLLASRDTFKVQVHQPTADQCEAICCSWINNVAGSAAIPGIKLRCFADVLVSHHCSGKLTNIKYLCCHLQVYVAVGGQTIMIDLMQLPSLTPRQMSLLAKHGPHGEYIGDSAAEESTVSSTSVASTLVGFSSNYIARRMGTGSGDEQQPKLQLPKYTPINKLPR